MALIQINVANKVATYVKRSGSIVCGNSDYEIEFAFDSEWDAYEDKTARFTWGGKYVDKVFKGNTCQVPVLRGTDAVRVGVYAGDLCTTTPAVIPCQRSILCGTDTPHEENEKQYASEAQKAAESAAESAARAEATLGQLDEVEKALDDIIVLQTSLIGGAAV